jgi:hypothetical protein
MCDYSLKHVASRPASVGDKLVSSGFAGTFTRGFASVDDPNMAICLRPGTEIAFERNVRRHVFWPFSRALPDKVARFRQVDPDMPYSHHDALEFPDGRILLVTSLSRGQRATVLQLPSSSRPERGREKQAPAAQMSSSPAD